MDLIGHALQLIKSVSKRAAEAKSNLEDCKRLAELAVKTEDILKSIGANPSNEPSLLRALEAICEALEAAEEAIHDCSESNVLVGLLRSQKHHINLKAAATQIGDALNLIPLAMIGQSSEDRSQLESLIVELRNVQFKQSLDSMTRMAELQRQMDINFNRMRDGMSVENRQIQDGQEKLSEMIRDLQSTIGDDREAKADLKLLRADLAKAQSNKEAREQYQLEQIIAVLECMDKYEATDAQTSETAVTDNPPTFILCPISKQVMRDPVLVIESGMTYERSSIVEWFELGNSTDPLTRGILTSQQFAPNIAVRSEAHAYLTKAGISFSIPEDHSTTIELKLDPRTFGGYNDKPGERERHVSPNELSVTGHDWNKVNHVKTTRVLLPQEWIGAERVNGDQIGIGVSMTRVSDGGIRFNENSVGIYLDAKKIHWGKAEEAIGGGINEHFTHRLVRDREGWEGMWICAEYDKNKLWYRHPHMRPIDFDLPDTFKGKPLYGHYQVWNDKKLRFL